MSDDPPEVDSEVTAVDMPDAATVRTGARIWRMMASAAAGWVAGFVMTAPIKFFDVWRDATAEQQPLLAPLSRGLFVWTAITLILAVAFVALVLGPLATLLPSRWVLWRPWLASIALPVVFFVPLGFRLMTWYIADPGPYDVPGPSYADYTLFILVFFAVVSMNYVRLLSRATRPL